MKKIIFTILALFCVVFAFAQTKNLKNADKQLKKNQLDVALQSLNAATLEEENIALTNFWLTKARIYSAIIGNLSEQNPKLRNANFDALMNDDFMSAAYEALQKAFSTDASGKTKFLSRSDINNLADADYNYGVVLFQNNDLLKAANAFQQSYNARLLNDATDTSALYNVGLCADKGGDEEIARKAFLQLIEMNTSMTGAYTLMANTYVPVYQDAAKKLADATNNINRIKYNQNIAKQELLQKEDDIKTTTEGLKKLKDAKTRQMSQDYIVKWQGDLITLRDELVRYEEALPALEAIVAENQKIVDEAGLNAAKYADLATLRFPDDYNTLINAASIHLTIDNSDRAEEILNGMKEQYSDNKLVFYALGVAYGMMNEDTKAEEAYQQALELDPDYFEPAYNLAVLYIDKGAALELKAGNLPLNAKSEYEALTKQASELYKKATPTIEKSLELKPNDQAVMEALQRLYLFLSKSDASYFQKYQDIKSQIEELYP